MSHQTRYKSATEAEEIWDDEDLVPLLSVGQTLVDYVGNSDWEQGVVDTVKENTVNTILTQIPFT